MKKISSIVLSICALMLISGCMKYNVSMEINEDKSMNLEIIYAIDEEAIDGMMENFSDSMTSDSSTSTDEEVSDNDLDSDTSLEIDSTEAGDLDSDLDLDMNYEDNITGTDLSSMTDTKETEEIFEKRGYKVEEYKKDGYTGIKATLEIDNIDNVSVEEELEVVLSDIMDEDFDDSKFFTVKKGLFSNTYVANFIYKVEENADTSYSSYLSGMDFTYSVILPSESISNNADSEKDNKLTWNIELDKETKIEYSFEMPNNTNKMIAIGIGVGVLLIIIILIICIAVSSSKKKKKNTVSLEVNNTNQNVANSQYKDDMSNNVTNETIKPLNKCRYCNSDITDDQAFCINCGNKLK